MSDIKVFNNEEFGTLRVAEQGGETWFVARDVCDALGLRNVGQAAERLDPDEASSIILNDGTPGNPRKIVVNEAGLYTLVLSSRKPEARAFKRWVTHEVLPSIRRDGAYVASDGGESDEDLIARALIAANRAIERKNKLIDEMRPKALFADAVAASDGTCLVSELAKMMRQNGFEVGQNRLFEILRNDGFLMKDGSSKNLPTQRSMELGLFRIKETAITHSDGHVTINRTPKVTGKGQRYFVERYCHAEAQA